MNAFLDLLDKIKSHDRILDNRRQYLVRGGVIAVACGGNGGVMFQSKKGNPRKSRCEERMSNAVIEPWQNDYWERMEYFERKRAGRR